MQVPKSEYLRIKVVPRSAKTECVDIMTDSEGEKTIKIRIKAIPEKGKANAELIKFLSREFSIPKGQISILSGQTEQLKLIKIKWT